MSEIMLLLQLRDLVSAQPDNKAALMIVDYLIDRQSRVDADSSSLDNSLSHG